MDESTSTNTKHVFSILVCPYNRTTKRIAVEHLGSVDVPSCTSETFTMKPRNCFFITHSWKKWIALLADSANTMRGKIPGVGTLIRARDASHRLDIDEESCHHMHNIVKKLTSFFDWKISSGTYLVNLSIVLIPFFYWKKWYFTWVKSSESQLLAMPVVGYSLWCVCGVWWKIWCL